VLEGDVAAGSVFGEELAAVSRSTVGRAQGDEVAGLVAASFGAGMDVMHVHEAAFLQPGTRQRWASRESTVRRTGGWDALLRSP
jgi:hypothetical protein